MFRGLQSSWKISVLWFILGSGLVLAGPAQTTDLEARKDLKALINKAVAAGRIADAVKMINDYRARFQPSANDPEHLFWETYAIASFYSNEGRPQQALRAWLSEHDVLPAFDVRFKTFATIEYAVPSYVELDRTSECRRYFEEYRAVMLKKIAALSKIAEPSDEEKAALNLHRRHADKADLCLKRLDLLGQPAPPLMFEQVINAKPFSLKDLKGKVVLVDFWATWCGYCKLGYPEIRDLRAAFKGQDFEAIGVTSFQGNFADEKVAIKESGISKEREVELTRKFAAAYGMDWPVGLLGSSVYDPAYTVNGLPFTVVIDKAGKVRQILSGHGHSGQVRRMVYRLLAE
jgi:thiol-disulfide isomerase/thioredoxin